MTERSYVKNAADKKQVKDAGRKEQGRRNQEKEDLRYVLSDPRGRRFIWRLLGHCKVYESIWSPSARIHYDAGRQDVGHFVMAEVVEADQSSYLMMMNENSSGVVDEGVIDEEAD